MNCHGCGRLNIKFIEHKFTTTYISYPCTVVCTIDNLLILVTFRMYAS